MGRARTRVGGPGDDVHSDGPGADAVGGNPGADLIAPQDDGTPDDYSGGSGLDTISYVGDSDSYFDDGVSVSLDGAANDGTDCPAQCERDNVEIDVDNVVGSVGSDNLVGSFLGNVLEAGYGFDTVDGGAGNDVIRGGPEADVLAGGAGDDNLRGEDGDDSLDGGPETDGCYGDEGVDTAVFCETAIGIP